MQETDQVDFRTSPRFQLSKYASKVIFFSNPLIFGDLHTPYPTPRGEAKRCLDVTGVFLGQEGPSGGAQKGGNDCF